MADSRESRARAEEIKFVVDVPLGQRIREWARARLQADPHGAGPFGDQYHTSTLYLDTEALDVFQRRGSYGRAKYRIRRYANSDYVFLERKLRKPRLLVKRRTRMDIDRIDPAVRADDRHRAEWFYERVAVRRLQPACLISYDRTARAIETSVGTARLTLDENVRGAAPCGYQIADVSVTGAPVLPDRVIVELKYRDRLPAIFRELVETFALQTQTASKYRLSMSALGHIEAAGAPLAAAALNEVRD